MPASTPPSGGLITPAARYFVMGDNRDYSYDSRSWGFLTGEQILGVVREVISSEDPKSKTPRPARAHLPLQRGNSSDGKFAMLKTALEAARE